MCAAHFCRIRFGCFENQVAAVQNTADIFVAKFTTHLPQIRHRNAFGRTHVDAANQSDVGDRFFSVGFSVFHVDFARELLLGSIRARF
jgi:hypothetical protein